MRETIRENSPEAIFSVDLNIRCSRKWAMPDTPGGSSAAPTRYQTMCVTTGARWSGTTTTCMPLDKVNSDARRSVVCAARGSCAKASIIVNANRVESETRTRVSILCPLCRRGPGIDESESDDRAGGTIGLDERPTPTTLCRVRAQSFQTEQAATDMRPVAKHRMSNTGRRDLHLKSAAAELNNTTIAAIARAAVACA